MQRRLLNEKEAAQLIGFSRSFLRQGRCYGDRQGRTPTPPFIRVGRRAVRYDINALEAWMQQWAGGTS